MKKTEHTIVSHNSRNSERQNIHVMLSYAKSTNPKKPNKKTRLFCSSHVIGFLEQFVMHFFSEKEKKRSTQSSLTIQETQSVKIFTSCCLMQK